MSDNTGTVGGAVASSFDEEGIYRKINLCYDSV